MATQSTPDVLERSRTGPASTSPGRQRRRGRPHYWRRRLAALLVLALAATLVGVFPANLHMALHPDRYPSLSPGLLWGRLALQPLAIWWALAATKPDPGQA